MTHLLQNPFLFFHIFELFHRVVDTFWMDSVSYITEIVVNVVARRNDSLKALEVFVLASTIESVWFYFVPIQAQQVSIFIFTNQLV